MAGTDVDALQRASDEFNAATTPLAELQMNAAASALLSGKTESQVDPDRL
jgi:hypothetical protein